MVRWSATGAILLVCLLLTSACGNEREVTPETAIESSSTPSGSPTASPTQALPSEVPSPSASPSSSASQSAPADPAHAMPGPASLTTSLSGHDLLVYSQEEFTDQVLADVAAVVGVTDTEPLALAQVSVEDRILQVAAVDPATYWRFNKDATAMEPEVWARVAGGELAINQKAGESLQDSTGSLRMGNAQDAPSLHIGAYAPQIPQIDAVVNTTWVDELGMKANNAILVSTGTTSPQSIRPQIEAIVGEAVSVQILGPDLDITVQQTAFLSGGSVAAAVGSFSYQVLGGGRIAPDPTWVAANIRTESVPILGQVTCHRVVLPQLRAALTEIASRGLAGKIYPEQYAGCYYPRFIAGSTKLSLHSFGIALDLNVPGNQRGTVGEMDRTVVAIFKKWGFAWGGDWNFTDPMHFEMDRVVQPR